MSGWIKLHRNILKWEWYTDPNTVRLFFHLLLKANHKAENWRGMEIERGQLVTGRKKLALEIQLTEQQIRTSINKLISTNNITVKSTNKNSVITIVNYDLYQYEDKKVTNETTNESPPKEPTNQPTNNQQPNQQITTNKNLKNKRTKELKNNTTSIDSKKSKQGDDNVTKNLTVIKYPSESIPYEAAKYLRGCILEFNQNAKVPGDTVLELQKWADTFRLITERDKRTVDDIRRVLKFIFKQDDFWCGVIQSPTGLRRNWDKVWGKMLTQKPKDTADKIEKLMEDHEFREWMEEETC